ncbi:MAG: hypothetical protein H6Q72_3686 [Firmicutes bacterium]|nr:hypothetical protein [Bacillota bacterium]
MSKQKSSKTIKSLALILENCEEITFKAEHIKFLTVNEISRGFTYSHGSISEHITANDIQLTICAQANIMTAYADDFPIPDRELPFDRMLRHNDITHIEVVCNDNTEEYIGVYWDGDEDNIRQVTSLDFEEDLTISINPNNQNF